MVLFPAPDGPTCGGGSRRCTLSSGGCSGLDLHGATQVLRDWPYGRGSWGSGHGPESPAAGTLGGRRWAVLTRASVWPGITVKDMSCRVSRLQGRRVGLLSRLAMAPELINLRTELLLPNLPHLGLSSGCSQLLLGVRRQLGKGPLGDLERMAHPSV